MAEQVVRSSPHPLRVVSKSAQLVAVVSLTLLLFLVAIGGSTIHDQSDVLVILGRLAFVSYVVFALTARRANAIGPVLRMWSGAASVFIARPPQDVWDFIRPAETAPAVEPKVRRAFTVPGTPRGIGELQCFVSEVQLGALYASIVEVVDEQPSRFAAVRSVTGPPLFQRYEIADAVGGSQLTYHVELSALKWSAYTIHPRKQAATAAEQYVASVKRVIESLPPSGPPATQSATPPPYVPPLGPPAGPTAT